MPFTAAPKKMIYLGINVTKYRGSVYWKLQNTDDEIKGLNNWKDSVYWLESNTVKTLNPILIIIFVYWYIRKIK